MQPKALRIESPAHKPAWSKTTRPAKVVACLPTYNSAGFVTETLRSLAAQTYPQLQILISDDASTDATVTVCERFARRDPRFTILRQKKNLGWVRNSNALLQAADGEYVFRAGHDDVYEPDYVARLTDQLESDPDAVLAYSDSLQMGKDGSWEVQSFKALEHVGDPLMRATVIARRSPNWFLPGAGVVRLSKERRVGGLKRHLRGEIGADWPWLMKLALLGDFIHVPEPLCTKVVTTQSLSKSWPRSRWSYTALAGSTLLQLQDTELSTLDRLRLQQVVMRFGWRSLTKRSWSGRQAVVSREIRRHVPARATLILVDEGRLSLENMGARRTLPFPEKQGTYWGPPAGDEEAIAELDRLRASGAGYLAFSWPAFWWLEYYSGFNRYVRTGYSCVFESDDVVIFRLSRVSESEAPASSLRIRVQQDPFQVSR